MIFESKNNIDFENLSNSEILKEFVQICFNNSKKLLNDFENYEQINNYIDLYYISFNNENENSLRFVKFKKYENKVYSKFEQIPMKEFYYNFFYEIENLFSELINILKEKISYKKHIEQLKEIEQLLCTNNYYSFNFVENIINSFYFCFYENDNYNKVNIEITKKYLSEFKLNTENVKNENIKFHYKVLRNVFNRITKILCKILNENEINFSLESLI